MWRILSTVPLREFKSRGIYHFLKKFSSLLCLLITEEGVFYVLFLNVFKIYLTNFPIIASLRGKRMVLIHYNVIVIVIIIIIIIIKIVVIVIVTVFCCCYCTKSPSR